MKDLVGAFAQFPHLPKMLNRQAILDTLVQGCREGQFVLRVTRPDRSTRTIWRRQPDEADLKNSTLEVVLPESAELSGIEPGLLAPGTLPDLWTGPDIAVADVRAYFSGGKVLKVARQGYDEPVTIPRASREAVDEAIGWAVKEGKLWLTNGPTSLLGEDIPSGLLVDDSRLQPPPSPIPATAVLPVDLAGRLGRRGDHGPGDRRRPLHQGRQAPAVGDGPRRDRRGLPRASPGAGRGLRPLAVRFRRGEWGQAPENRWSTATSPATASSPTPEVLVASAYLGTGELQELADQIGEIGKAAVGFEMKISVRIEVGSGGKRPPGDVVARINEKLGEISEKLALG